MKSEIESPHSSETLGIGWITRPFPADEIAIRFHHELVGVIRPFPNGKRRTMSRLHADVIAVKLERPEFTWGQNSIWELALRVKLT